MSFEVLQAIALTPGSALVTVVRVRGSTPRAAGARMAVLPDGSIAGTVGGGVLEASAIERAKACIAGRTSGSLAVELTGHDALGAVPVCGGVADLWIESVEDPAPYAAALSHLEAGRMVVLVSRAPVAGAPPRAAAVFAVDGLPLHGSAEGADALEAARAASTGEPVLREDTGSFYDPVSPPDRLLVLGCGHVGRSVAELAVTLDFRVTVADDRLDFADPRRFPRGVETLNVAYARCIGRFPFGPSTYVLIVTPGHASDLDCARALLGKEYRYVGLIGSKRKVRTVKERLVCEGFDRARVEAIRAPVGIDIGAETPAEIAVSILAEMISTRRGRGGQARPRSSSSRPASSAPEKQ